MKYTNIRTSPNDSIVQLVLACSHGKCTQVLNGDENFCPECGSKLNKIPRYLDKEGVLAIINENVHKLQHSIESNDPYANRESSDTKTDSFNRSTAINDMDGKQKCPYGKECPSKCGHCTGKGACNVAVLASMPPQYNMCPFCGSGYIDCSEAE